MKRQPRLKLPRLTDAQYSYAQELTAKSGIPINVCPTCGSKQDSDGIREYGTFKYLGQEWPCDCDTQIQLRKHYLLANIPDQFQRLDWNDFQGSEEVKTAVNIFLYKWPSFKVNGMGLEFSSPNLGVGKTFAATHVAKELVKLGESVFFTPFSEVVSALVSPDEKEIAMRMKDTTVLVLDEVIPAITDAQHGLFSEIFEQIIRHRTNFNRVTIMTTNMTPKDLHREYPRTYSLLEAKQDRIEMTGKDARKSWIAMDNWEIALNGEVRPIT